MKNIVLSIFVCLSACVCALFSNARNSEIKKTTVQNTDNQEINRLIKENKPIKEIKREDTISKKLKSKLEEVQDNESKIKPEDNTDHKFKKLKNKKTNLAKEKSESGLTKSDCNLSGHSQKKINSYAISITDNFLNDEDIEELLEMHLGDIKKGWPNKCPLHCSAVNDYSIFAKAYPLSVKKNSCDKQEAKETYPIEKSFSMRSSDKEAKKEAYKEAGDWMFSVFIKSFLPFSKNLPKEVAEYKIDSACPSCSFYLDYTYKYTKEDKLDLNVKAHCGDRRTLFSKFKSDFFLQNNWKCAKKR